MTELTTKVKELREQGMNRDNIMKTLNLSRRQVDKIVKLGGLTGQSKNQTMILSEEQIVEITELIKAKVLQKDIALRYGIALTTLKRLLNRNNIDSKLYKVKHDYFSVIDCEEKAYWLGFLYADGYNAKTRNQVKLKLHDQDLHILEKFRDCLITGSGLPMNRDKNTLSIQLSSKQLCQDLHDLGCVQAKSLILQLPTFLNDELMRHFIRGYFDGDGSIFYKERPSSKEKYIAVSFTGCINFITQLNNFLQEKINLSNVKTAKQQDGNNAFQCVYTKYSDIQAIKNYFYENSDPTLRLERKFNKFPSLEEITETIKQRKISKTKKWRESSKGKGYIFATDI